MSITLHPKPFKKGKKMQFFSRYLQVAAVLSSNFEVIAFIDSYEEKVACKWIMEKMGLSMYQVIPELSFFFFCF